MRIHLLWRVVDMREVGLGEFPRRLGPRGLGVRSPAALEEERGDPSVNKVQRRTNKASLLALAALAAEHPWVGAIGLVVAIIQVSNISLSQAADDVPDHHEG